MQLFQVIEAADINVGYTVISDPQVFEIYQVVKGFSRNPSYDSFLYAKLYSIHRNIHRDLIHVRVITEYRPSNREGKKKKKRERDVFAFI